MNSKNKEILYHNNNRFSPEQLLAINLENKNILVSAGAGSGKTTVLIERIVRELEEGVCNIDEMLIMTFTRESTAEMKNRLKIRLDKRIRELKYLNDNNRYNKIQKLRLQSLFIHNANIQTIDSFCKQLVDENFSKIEGFDAKYRIADEQELNLFIDKLLTDFLESKYGVVENGISYNDFFVNYFNKDDELIKKNFIDGIKFLDTLPFVDDFFNTHIGHFIECEKKINENAKNIELSSIIFIDYDVEKRYKKNNDYIFLVLLRDFYKLFEARKITNRLLAISDFQKYALKLLYKSDNDGIRKFSDLSKILQDKFKRIYIDEYQDTSELQEEMIRALSNDFNNNNVFMVGDIKQCIYTFRNANPKNFISKFDEYYDISNGCYDNENNILIKLDKNFRSSKEVITFTNDLFKNIMVKDFGNIDYKEKGVALSCGRDKDENQIETYNKQTEFIVFKDITTGITCELNNILQLKQKQQKQYKKDNIDTTEIDKEIDEIKAKKKWNKNLMAQIIFERIKKLHDIDNVQYKDIVILHYSPKSIATEYLNEAKKLHIPFTTVLKTGFYTSYEITLIIAILSIVDNPINDVDLTTVLTSKIINISDIELVYIKYYYNYILENLKEQNIDKNFLLSLFEKLVYIYDNGFDENFIIKENLDKKEINQLYSKIKHFFDVFTEFREYQRVKSLSELISIIYDETNLYNYMRAMEDGDIRIANLDLFLSKAKSFENSSYFGLFNFLRYMEQLKTNNVDEGSETSYDDNANVVRLMSIHKSKGLEFPIVILPNLAYKFREQQKVEEIDKAYFSKKYGVGLRYVDFENKYSLSTIKRSLIIDDIKDEILQEHFRLVYVALTRAKEKLILATKLLDKEYTVLQTKIESNDTYEKSDNELIDEIKNYKKYHDMFINNVDVLFKNQFKQNLIVKFPTEIYDRIKENEVHNNIEKGNIYENDFLLNINSDLSNIVNIDDKEINNNLDKRYKYQYLINEKPKYSVSEIKHNSQIFNYSSQWKIKREKQLLYLDNMDNEGEVINDIDRVDGSQLGNAFHSFMEKYDFKTDVEKFIYNNEKQFVILMPYLDNIYKFLHTDLCSEILYAIQNNKFFREKRFMFEISLDTLKAYMKKQNPDYIYDESDELKKSKVIVQGVIDAFYIDKNDEVVVIDYKTDGLQNKDINETTLIDLYSIQLEIYARAISSITNKKVSKKIIYSFALNKVVLC